MESVTTLTSPTKTKKSKPLEIIIELTPYLLNFRKKILSVKMTCQRVLMVVKILGQTTLKLKGNNSIKNLNFTLKMKFSTYEITSFIRNNARYH